MRSGCAISSVSHRFSGWRWGSPRRRHLPDGAQAVRGASPGVRRHDPALHRRVDRRVGGERNGDDLLRGPDRDVSRSLSFVTPPGPAAFALLGLVALCRTEGIILVGLVAVREVVVARTNRSERHHRLSWFAALTLGAAGGARRVRSCVLRAGRSALLLSSRSLATIREASALNPRPHRFYIGYFLGFVLLAGVAMTQRHDVSPPPPQRPVARFVSHRVRSSECCVPRGGYRSRTRSGTRFTCFPSLLYWRSGDGFLFRGVFSARRTALRGRGRRARAGCRSGAERARHRGGLKSLPRIKPPAARLACGCSGTRSRAR